MASSKKEKRVIVVTVRMTERDKQNLHKHCLKRSRATGRPVSMNEAMIDLIRAAPR